MRPRGVPSLPSSRVATRDATLTARVVSRTPLHYADGADVALDRPAHVRAGSSLASIGDRLVIVQDDANFIAVLAPSDGRVASITLPADASGKRQFDDDRGNKSLKLDLEASIAVTDGAATTLFAFGSGSHHARERVAVVSGWETGANAVEIVAVPAFYAALRASTAFAGSALNLEGAALRGDELWLFGRGNGAARGDLQPINATCVVDWSSLRAHLASPATAPAPTPRQAARYDLGELGGIALGFTDALAIGDAFLYSAAAEDSLDAITDGPVTGSAIGVIAAGDSIRWAPLLDANGSLFAGKVEGIAWRDEARDHLHAVLDHDAPSTPAELCVVALEGPWFNTAP